MNGIRLAHLTSEVRWTLVGVFGALMLASAICWLLKYAKPKSNFKELDLRIKTWWVIVGVLSIAIILDRTVSLIFWAFVSFLALREYLTLIPTRPSDQRVHWWAYGTIPVQFLWVYLEWYGMFLVFIPVYLFLLLPTRMVLIGETKGFLSAIGTLHWGLMTTVFSLSHAAMLLSIHPVETGRAIPIWPSEESATSPGPGLLILLVLLTQGNDVAQFIWGKLFGKIKVVPRVSPGKTLAGLLGGIFTTTVLAIALGPQLAFFDWQHSLLIGLIIGVGGFAGDVSISAIKRDLGVKDSGAILPGHGGILDRVDSLTYTAPLFFHVVYYFYCSPAAK